MRQTHFHGNFGYPNQGKRIGAVAQMEDNKHRRGDQWVGIGYTASSKCTTNWLVRVYRNQWRRKGQAHRRLAKISWLVRVYRGLMEKKGANTQKMSGHQGAKSKQQRK